MKGKSLREETVWPSVAGRLGEATSATSARQRISEDRWGRRHREADEARGADRVALLVWAREVRSKSTFLPASVVREGSFETEKWLYNTLRQGT